MAENHGIKDLAATYAFPTVEFLVRPVRIFQFHRNHESVTARAIHVTSLEAGYVWPQGVLMGSSHHN